MPNIEDGRLQALSGNYQTNQAGVLGVLACGWLQRPGARTSKDGTWPHTCRPKNRGQTSQQGTEILSEKLSGTPVCGRRGIKIWPNSGGKTKFKENELGPDLAQTKKGKPTALTKYKKWFFSQNQERVYNFKSHKYPSFLPHLIY
jgi:hypothetical protein